MANKSLYTSEEQLYLILEMKKLVENHGKMPTLFIYPTAKFTFQGIYFQDSVNKFQLTKNSIQDKWKIIITGNIIDTNFDSIYDVVKKMILENGFEF